MGKLAHAEAMAAAGATREEVDEQLAGLRVSLRELAEDKDAPKEDREWARKNLEALGEDVDDEADDEVADREKRASRASMSTEERKYLEKVDAAAAAEAAPKRASIIGGASLMPATMTQAQAAARVKELQLRGGGR
jgi:hypothetical protein